MISQWLKPPQNTAKSKVVKRHLAVTSVENSGEHRRSPGECNPEEEAELHAANAPRCALRKKGRFQEPTARR